MKKRFLLILVSIVALLVVACSDDATPEPTEQAEVQATAVSQIQDTLALALTSWQVESFGDPENLEPVDPINAPTLNFFLTRYFGYGGCNWALGVYEVDGSEISILTPSQTNFECSDEAQELDTTFISALRNITTFSIEDEQLIGYTVNDQQLITLVARQTVPLEETVWNLAFTVVSEGSTAPIVNNSTITATFSGDEISGTTACSTYSASFEIGEDAAESDQVLSAPVTVGEVAIETAAENCESLEAVQEQDAAFVNALESVATIEHAGGTVVMYDAQGNVVLALGARAFAE